MKKLKKILAAFLVASLLVGFSASAVLFASSKTVPLCYDCLNFQFKVSLDEYDDCVVDVCPKCLWPEINSNIRSLYIPKSEKIDPNKIKTIMVHAESLPNLETIRVPDESYVSKISISSICMDSEKSFTIEFPVNDKLTSISVFLPIVDKDSSDGNDNYDNVLTPSPAGIFPGGLFPYPSDDDNYSLNVEGFVPNQNLSRLENDENPENSAFGIDHLDPNPDKYGFRFCILQ